MKHSIRRQMIAVFVGLIVCMLVILLLLVGSGLEPYYIREKKDNFTELYNEIDQITQNGEMTEDEISQINRTAERYNFYYIVWNFSNESGFSNLHDSQMLLMQLAGVLFNKIDSQVMEKNDNYQVVEFRDSAQQVDYLALWGTVGDSYNIFIRSPLESIQETMVLFYRFLIIVGLGVIAGGILFVWYFSRRLTEPLRELAVLSARMADLDFDAKYTSGGGGEIGALGENFNTMSEKLEATISELKNANFRLQQDIEQKEKIEKMRTDFMGNVSHELKTPIALIQGYAEGLKEGVSDDAQSREFYCDVIMDEASKMNQMVKNLMTLNQLEFGDEDVEFQRFDLTELIRGVLQSMEIMAQQKEARVQFRQREPVYVWADEFKAEQVVRNYVSNAFNHLDGDRVVDVKIIPSGDKVRVTVFNTGIPIPEEDVPHIWEKFYKVDKAHTREYGGNGIGLSIVKAIMDSFHQEYGVKNYDNGVEFWFELDVK
ncbi:HAMP domain-containing protein [Faecalicatena contorta]|uniref:sensor histidine kinase n=1 Tax=Faecalicatena contorta TaxID=39482 RepID=UPI00174AAC5D|nr:HAMP domain-containing sensor histidine kinase [Faecalicatena contorta]MBM6684933.1 HAMP domain-containing protein [Faecalicatena contorta]MBM6710461.1 HAMP domain-containing protein [Faecalicatena contorta]HIX99670.1 HAMP domain-containing histidine kinase [Candidatus Dorea intestinigallinarum]